MNRTIETAKLLEEMADSEKAKNLLTEIAGSYQFVALDTNDIRTIISQGDLASICCGYGEECIDALNEAIRALQSQNKSISQAKGILVTVSVQEKDDMMETVKTLDTFLNNIPTTSKYKWGLSAEKRQQQPYKVTVMYVE
jgi:cell division GTPase FtsZ